MWTFAQPNRATMSINSNKRQDYKTAVNMSSLVFSGFAFHFDTSQVSPIIVNAAGVVGATFFGSRFLAADSFIPRDVGGFKGN